MSYRASSLQATNTLAINREIGSKYDAVLAVKDKLTEIEIVAGIDIDALLAELEAAQDFTGITVVAGDHTSWDAINKVITVESVKGDKGDTGSTGEQGPIGPQGLSITGPQGIKGDKGEMGATGPRGFTGDKGDKGDTGEAGADLTVEQIVYNGDGTFTWQFSDGTSYHTPNLKGPQGATGSKGDKGDTGISVHHIKGTSTTDSEGDFASYGEIDTYTVYGDAAETINLGYFRVNNGAAKEGQHSVMYKSTYDTDNSGVVDNAEKLEGKTVAEIQGEILGTKGQPLGIASLDIAGLVPASQLPSYVDDCIIVSTKAELPVVGEYSKIYIVIADESSNGDTSSYRWAGSTYAMVSNTLNAADVKALYESNTNTNAFTDALKTKLDGIENEANKYVHPASGVTAGTYRSVNVDINGHVTTGTNPTTVSGYGITDVYTKTEGDVNYEPKNINIQGHIASTSNPHGVTKTQVGLGSVDNTSDANKPVSTAQQAALNLKLDSSVYTANDVLAKVKTVDGSGSGLDADLLDGNDSTYFATAGGLSGHTSRVDNPHSVTKAQVGLGSVDNTSDANKPISTATQTALNGKQDTLVSGTNIKTIEGQSLVGSGNIDLGKGDVGLGNVDNTADSVKVVASAGKWTTGRDITLAGAVTGTVNVDGSANVSITTSVGTSLQNTLDSKVERTSATGSAKLPVGTTAQRDASPIDGMIRYNSTLKGFEGYFNGQWQSVGGGQMFGNAVTKAVSYNAQVISENIGVTAGVNAYSVGDVTIADGYSLTIANGSIYKIL